MNNSLINTNNDDEHEIDFSEIIQTLLRRKSIIAVFGLISIIFSVTAALSSKRIWEGNFQIVIESNNNNLLNKNFGSNLLKNLALQGGVRNSLKTEVAILRSPLLLNKIYEYVLKEKKITKEDLLYEYWRDDIKIELSKNSSVLDISYRDSDKKLIISTLQELSDSYQTYSGQSRLRNLELGLEYFKNQIKLYKNKSSESIAKVQEFAIENDFNFFVGSLNEITEESKSTQKINVEVSRLEASNNLRDIDVKLEQIQDLKDDKDFLKYLSKSILKDNVIKMYNKLLNIEEKLAFARNVYKQNDKQIKFLEKDRDALIYELKKETINFLKGSKFAEEIRLKKYERSNEAIIKYRQLITEAEKDLITYDQLIESYTSLELERARYKDPWRLISNPKLLNIPVAPKRKRMVLVSLMASLIVGSGVAFYDEKKRKIIYSLKEIIRISTWKLLADLSFSSKDKWGEVCQLLQLGYFSKLKGKVGILIIGDIEKEKINILTKKLNQISTQLSFILEQDFLNLAQYENIIAVTELGVTKSNEIYESLSKLDIMERSVNAFINISI